MLAYDSGSSAKLIRLLGVDCPELDGVPALPPPRRTLLTRSGILSEVAVGDGAALLTEFETDKDGL